MYYAIELYEKQDITIKNVKNSYLHEIMEDLPLYKNKKVFTGDNCITVIDGKQLTAYYKCEEKRNNMVANMLNFRYKKAIDYLNSPIGDMVDSIN